MIWFSSQLTALKRSTLETHAITSTMAMPLNRELDRVCITSLITLYIKTASMATSTMLCQSGCSKRLVNSAPMGEEELPNLHHVCRLRCVCFCRFMVEGHMPPILPILL